MDALAFDSHGKSVAYDIPANRVDVQIFTAGDVLSDAYVAEMQSRAEAVADGVPVFITVIDGEVTPV